MGRHNEYQLRLGRCRSGIALVMRHRQVVYPPTDSTAYEMEMSTPLTVLLSMAVLYLYLYLESTKAQVM